jgi:hypothetical protein
VFPDRKNPPLQHHEHDFDPEVPAPVKANLLMWFDATGTSQGPHTMSAELVQTVRLYWPVEHTEQSVHVVAPPSENFPAEQDWQAEGLV